MSTNGKSFLFCFKRSFILANKKLSKTSMHRHFKGRLTNQTVGIEERITKVLDKDTFLAKKIRTPFREQGITITSVLTAIGMAIGILVKALLPGGGGVTTQGKGGGNGKPEDLKEWLRNKLKALVSLLGKLGVKAAEALPGIIEAMII